MKAIETWFGGVLHRSRLEARWAVVFDRLGIITEYEPEGFTHGEECYLPDFRLVETGDFVSIKPDRRSVNPEEWMKEIRWQGIFAEAGTVLWIIAGQPQVGKYQLLSPLEGEFRFADCRLCSGTSYTDDGGSWGEIGKHSCGSHDRNPTEDTRIRSAFRAAMAERFGGQSKRATASRFRTE
jgi:hypothetical protein